MPLSDGGQVVDRVKPVIIDSTHAGPYLVHEVEEFDEYWANEQLSRWTRCSLLAMSIADV